MRKMRRALLMRLCTNFMTLAGRCESRLGPFDYRPVTRLFRIAGWVSLALIVTYVLNSMVLYLQDH